MNILMSSLSMLIFLYSSSTFSMRIINLRFLSVPSFESKFLWRGGYFVTIRLDNVRKPQTLFGLLDDGSKSINLFDKIVMCIPCFVLVIR